MSRPVVRRREQDFSPATSCWRSMVSRWRTAGSCTSVFIVDSSAMWFLFEILRDGQRMTLPVTMLERRDVFSNLPQPLDPRGNLVARLGILGMTLDPRVAEALPSLRAAAGVVVISTVDGALDSREGGLDQGDVVFAVNRTAVKSLADLRTAVDALSSGDPVVLQLERQGVLMYLTFTIE